MAVCSKHHTYSTETELNEWWRHQLVSKEEHERKTGMKLVWDKNRRWWVNHNVKQIACLNFQGFTFEVVPWIENEDDWEKQRNKMGRVGVLGWNEVGAMANWKSVV
jgi:hypothetical protein